jgi:dTDP-4-amino-4,6-dideoxygalactose transaminase
MIPAARPEFGPEEEAAVLRVLRSGMLAQGPEVDAFESEFSKTAVSGLQCIAVNSGTSALHLSLLALGVGPGDEVIVPSFTFAASANSIALTGATPVFADIDLDTYCLDPVSVAAVITSKTRAVMPVHLYGHPAPMVELADICERHSLLLVEDAAQAHLATLNGRPVGTWGDAAAFSFYPTKNMTSGEGGMIATPRADVHRQARLLRNQGQERRYENEIVGLNNRMTDLHAAIGRVQLAALPGRTARRQENARFLSNNLTNVVAPITKPGATHVFHQYTIRVPGHDRERFAKELAAAGVGSGVYYPHPVHTLPAFARSESLPATEQAASQVLSLPVYPSLTESELETIVSAVNAVAGAGA